ncbi:MAG: hypothetical protein Q9168_006503 [Polycauliona sp. 1 TL-2023]
MPTFPEEPSAAHQAPYHHEPNTLSWPQPHGIEGVHAFLAAARQQRQADEIDRSGRIVELDSEDDDDDHDEETVSRLTAMTSHRSEPFRPGTSSYVARNNIPEQQRTGPLPKTTRLDRKRDTEEPTFHGNRPYSSHDNTTVYGDDLTQKHTATSDNQTNKSQDMSSQQRREQQRRRFDARTRRRHKEGRHIERQILELQHTISLFEDDIRKLQDERKETNKTIARLNRRRRQLDYDEEGRRHLDRQILEQENTIRLIDRDIHQIQDERKETKKKITALKRHRDTLYYDQGMDMHQEEQSGRRRVE